MADQNSIKNALVAKITTTTVKALKEVFSYQPSSPDGYPYAVIVYLGDEDEVIQTNTNKRIYTFSIRLFQERMEDNFGAEKAERVIGEARDDVVALLDADQNLGQSDILYVERTINDSGYTESGTERLIEINLRFVTTVTITL